jgi:hypothetical protein
MPWNERGRHDAGAGFDRSKRKAAAEGVGGGGERATAGGDRSRRLACSRILDAAWFGVLEVQPRRCRAFGVTARTPIWTAGSTSVTNDFTLCSTGVLRGERRTVGAAGASQENGTPRSVSLRQRKKFERCCGRA